MGLTAPFLQMRTPRLRKAKRLNQGQAYVGVRSKRVAFGLAHYLLLCHQAGRASFYLLAIPSLADPPWAKGRS